MVINIKRVVLLYIIELLMLVVLSIIGFYVGPLFISQTAINELRSELMGTVNLGPNFIFLHSAFHNRVLCRSPVHKPNRN